MGLVKMVQKLGAHTRRVDGPAGIKFRDRELNPGLLRDRQKY